MKIYLLKLLVFAILLTPIMFCQDSPLPNGVYQHDGFFLRFIPGTGYSQVFESLPDYKDFYTFSGGFTFANHIQIGGTVSDNLIIFCDAGGVNILSPNVKKFDEEADNLGDVRFVFGGVGPGINYYLMPENIYISASILANVANVYIDGKMQVESNIGFGFDFIVGKEWWVGEQWGLGISLYFEYGSQSDKYIENLTISGYSFGVLFSATYN